MEIIEELEVWPTSEIRYVYKIYDCATNEVLYIGSSSSPQNRFYAHKNDRKKHLTLCDYPFKKRLCLGVIGVYEWWESLWNERVQIRKHKDEGHPLVNKRIKGVEHIVTRKSFKTYKRILCLK